MTEKYTKLVKVFSLRKRISRREKGKDQYLLMRKLLKVIFEAKNIEGE